ncbi:hypothetical protein [Levilactobacillus spicheri]|uniref:Uncharacterized protein n=1 Tax=Levilactobacillus spicheri TaxID=216463 RepID=A0ABQ0WPH7_9LACO|nr:hypothetical protein [Levilactobacillus spicheri]GEO66941.1 hypothetical protein LSP04_13600 [Levilactobacillus spicheri]
MTLSVRKGVAVLASVIIAAFWGMNLAYSLEVRTIATIAAMLICAIATWLLVNRWREIVSLDYSPYQSLFLTLVSGVLILVLLTKAATGLVGWLAWLWWLSGFLCLGLVVLLIAVGYGYLVEKR